MASSLALMAQVSFSTPEEESCQRFFMAHLVKQPLLIRLHVATSTRGSDGREEEAASRRSSPPNKRQTRANLMKVALTPWWALEAGAEGEEIFSQSTETDENRSLSDRDGTATIWPISIKVTTTTRWRSMGIGAALLGFGFMWVRWRGLHALLSPLSQIYDTSTLETFAETSTETSTCNWEIEHVQNLLEETKTIPRSTSLAKPP